MIAFRRWLFRLCILLVVVAVVGGCVLFVRLHNWINKRHEAIGTFRIVNPGIETVEAPKALRIFGEKGVGHILFFVENCPAAEFDARAEIERNRLHKLFPEAVIEVERGASNSN